MTYRSTGFRIAVVLTALLPALVFRASPVFAAAPPANDDFDHATLIAATPFTDTVDTSAATTAGDDPTTCGTPASTVWYSFTAAANETVLIDIGFIPLAAVSAYTGSRGALSQVACGTGPTTSAQWAAVAGVTYHIMVSNQLGGFFGVVRLHVRIAFPPANDNFDHATVITTVPFSTTFDRSGATSAPDDPSGCGGTMNSVWFSFTPAVDQLDFFDASGIGWSGLSAYTGARGSLTQVACVVGPTSTSWAATAGVTYHIMIADTANPYPTGTVTFNLTAFAAPPNNDFDHATPVTAVPFTDNLDIAAATTAADDPTACGGAANSVWYRFTPTLSETYIVTTGASSYRNSVSVYTGTRGALSQTACRTYPQAPGPTTWPGVAGVTYYVMVANLSGTTATDHLTLTLTGSVPPANDDFGHATLVSSLPFSDSIDASGASPAADDPTSCIQSTDNSVWYSVTPSVNEWIVVDTSASTYFALISVYTGSRGSLTQVACGNNNGKSSFQATAGVTYHIMLTNYSFPAPAGQLNLSVRGVLPPANDDISHATVITTLPFADRIDTTAATTAPGDPTCFNPPVATVWYKYTAPGSGGIVLSTVDGFDRFIVSAYTGSPGALTQLSCGLPYTNPFAVTKGATYYFMVSSLFSTIGGDLQFSVTALPDIAATAPCTRVLYGTITGAITARSGTTCLLNAAVSGAVTVLPGAQLLATGTTIKGSLTSDGATALAVCNSSITGSVTVRRSTGPVLIGDGGDSASYPKCLGSTIGGSIIVGGSSANGNKSGFELGGNTVAGAVMVSGNNPDRASVLVSDDAAVEIEGNHIGGVLSCSQNVAAPVNDGMANAARARSGQCQGL